MLPPSGGGIGPSSKPRFPGAFFMPSGRTPTRLFTTDPGDPRKCLLAFKTGKAPGQVSLPPGLFRGSRHGLLSPGRSGSLRNQRTTGVAMMLAWILLLLLLGSRSGLLTP